MLVGEPQSVGENHPVHATMSDEGGCGAIQSDLTEAGEHARLQIPEALTAGETRLRRARHPRAVELGVLTLQLLEAASLPLAEVDVL